MIRLHYTSCYYYYNLSFLQRVNKCNKKIILIYLAQRSVCKYATWTRVRHNRKETTTFMHNITYIIIKNCIRNWVMIKLVLLVIRIIILENYILNIWTYSNIPANTQLNFFFLHRQNATSIETNRNIVTTPINTINLLLYHKTK